MSLEAAQKVVASKTAPKVTKESIEAKIVRVEYVRIDTLTICVVGLENGFVVLGHSKPASDANYDKAVGEVYSYENAFKQIWQLEGYLLREKLHAETVRGHEGSVLRGRNE